MQPPPAPPRVLVVDDDPDVRALVAAVLSDDGYAVDAAHDAPAAVAALRASPPDAIVLDLMMPGLTGQDFLALYRRLPGPHAPVIVLSAANYGTLQMVAAGGEAVAVLAKPFSTDRLLHLIASCLNRRDHRVHSGARAA